MSPYTHIYFIGVGGIGMSALARYFAAQGYVVAGYDARSSRLTEELEREGIAIHYSDEPHSSLLRQLSPDKTLVIYTPAVSEDLGELVALRERGFRIIKRAEALAEATNRQCQLAIAGSHGKTTTSSLLAYILATSHVGASCFLGGISANFHSNLHIAPFSAPVVVEADEFDRSFLWLTPQLAIVTSIAADHLDIYGDETGYIEGFYQFAERIKEGGVLIHRQGTFVSKPLPAHLRIWTFDIEQQADIYADNIQIRQGRLFFDWHFPQRSLSFRGLELGTPIYINVVNATPAVAAAVEMGVTEEEIREALAGFKGTHRRFEKIETCTSHTLIDDYAHHPDELRAALESVKKLYPDEPILGIFQPHLYSRTADFFREFAAALSMLDEVILLPIYPAREEPIPGVTSGLIAEHISHSRVTLLEKEQLAPYLEKADKLPRIVVTLGAGDIDRLVPIVAETLANRKP